MENFILYLNTYWFLICLWMLSILVIIIDSLHGLKYSIPICILLLLTAHIRIAKTPIFYAIAFYLPFFLIGYFLRERDKVAFCWKKNVVIVSAVLWFVLFLFWDILNDSGKFYKSDVIYRNLIGILYQLLIGCVGCVFVLGVTHCIYEKVNLPRVIKSRLCLYGRNTEGIYFIHMQFGPLYALFHTSHISLFWGFCLMGTLIMGEVSMLVIRIIRCFRTVRRLLLGEE